MLLLEAASLPSRAGQKNRALQKPVSLAPDFTKVKKPSVNPALPFNMFDGLYVYLSCTEAFVSILHNSADSTLFEISVTTHTTLIRY